MCVWVWGIKEKRLRELGGSGARGFGRQEAMTKIGNYKRVRCNDK